MIGQFLESLEIKNEFYEGYLEVYGYRYIKLSSLAEEELEELKEPKK